MRQDEKNLKREHELAVSFVANKDPEDPNWHEEVAISALLRAYRQEILSNIEQEAFSLVERSRRKG